MSSKVSGSNNTPLWEIQLDKALDSGHSCITRETVVAAKCLFFQQLTKEEPKSTLLADKVTKVLFQKITRTGWMAYFDRVASATKNFFRSGFSECVSSEYLLLRSLGPKQLKGLLQELLDFKWQNEASCGEFGNIIEDIKSTFLTRPLSQELMDRGFTEDIQGKISSQLKAIEDLINPSLGGMVTMSLSSSHVPRPSSTESVTQSKTSSEPALPSIGMVVGELKERIGNLKTGFIFSEKESQIKELGKQLVQESIRKGWEPSDALIEKGYTKEGLKEISDLLALLKWGIQDKKTKHESYEPEGSGRLKFIPNDLKLVALRTYLGEPKQFLAEIKEANKEKVEFGEEWRDGRKDRQLEDLSFFHSGDVATRESLKTYSEKFIQDCIPEMGVLRDGAYSVFPHQLAKLAFVFDQYRLLHAVSAQFIEGLSEADLLSVLQSTEGSSLQYLEPFAALCIGKMCQKSLAVMDFESIMYRFGEAYGGSDKQNNLRGYTIEDVLAASIATQDQVNQLVDFYCNQYENRFIKGENRVEQEERRQRFISQLALSKANNFLELWKTADEVSVSEQVFGRFEEYMQQHPMTDKQIESFCRSSKEGAAGYQLADILCILRAIKDVGLIRSFLHMMATDREQNEGGLLGMRRLIYNHTKKSSERAKFIEQGLGLDYASLNEEDKKAIDGSLDALVAFEKEKERNRYR